MTRRQLIVAFLTAIATAAPGEEPDQILITADVMVGKQQVVSAASRSLEWSATRLDGDTVHIQLRVPVASFDSGHREFDALVRAGLEAERYPFVEVEGVVHGGRFEGSIVLHGISQPLALTPSVIRTKGRLTAAASFTLTLQDFAVSLPRTGGRVVVEFVAGWSMDSRAVIAGGSVAH